MDYVRIQKTMDQKVVCIFLIMIGMSHGLECYKGTNVGAEDNFDAVTATKRTCYDRVIEGVSQDVCFKSM